MAYDYHTAAEGKTGHIAPLYRYNGDNSSFLNVNFSMNYWLDKGVPADKLVMGIPTYGQSFTLPEEALGYVPGFHTEAAGLGEPGRFTRSPGFLAYYEVRDSLLVILTS